MRKLFLSLLATSLVALSANEVNAQARYRTALGLGIDVGDGPSLVGPQIKHFFDGTNAGNAQVLFGDDVTVLGVDYSYNQTIAGTNGLNWYIGVGPQLAFVDNGGDWWYGGRNNSRTFFALRPAAGLEYRIHSVPLAFHFDWKPWWNLTNNSNFEPARFSLGIKFALK